MTKLHFHFQVSLMTTNNFANFILFIHFFFSVILERTIRIPRSLSVKANSILKGFLNKNPADRLGCNRESGFAEIMTHQFFRNYIDWELVSPFLYLVLLVTVWPTLPIWLPFYKVYHYIFLLFLWTIFHSWLKNLVIYKISNLQSNHMKKRKLFHYYFPICNFFPFQKASPNKQILQCLLNEHC